MKSFAFQGWDVGGEGDRKGWGRHFYLKSFYSVECLQPQLNSFCWNLKMERETIWNLLNAQMTRITDMFFVDSKNSWENCKYYRATGNPSFSHWWPGASKYFCSSVWQAFFLLEWERCFLSAVWAPHLTYKCHFISNAQFYGFQETASQKLLVLLDQLQES